MSDLVDSLLSFIEASPTPYHCARTAAGRLDAAGFTEIAATESIPVGAGSYYRIDGGSIIAWSHGGSPNRFTVLGAHTDSPNLRVRANADIQSAGWNQLGVEVYGGVLLNSWLDRELGLTGRVTYDDGTILFHDDRPLLRIPQLAIHLDRKIREEGLKLDPQTQLNPVWSLESDTRTFRGYLSEQTGLPAESILAWDVMAFDTQKPVRFGRNGDMIAAARIDNQLSSFAATEAITQIQHDPIGESREAIAVLALFDHEEVGSKSATGAAGAALPNLLERIGASAGWDRTGYLEALSRSYVVSADCAHATHPNFVDRHEPDHHIAINGGVVVKRNANQRYASDALSEAPFRRACAAAEVPVQTYVHRNDLPCGSTIGPATAAELGVRTVDVGAPQLAMHSIREMCGTDDVGHLTKALASVLRIA